MHDIRLALRALQSTPVVSTIAALSLALGIGATTAIFSLVSSLLLRTLPVDHPERLVTISTDSATALGFNAGLGWNYPMWDAFRSRSQEFDGALAWYTQSLNLASSGEAQRADALVVSDDFFKTLGIRAARGRALTVDDDVRSGTAGPAVVLSHEFWQRQFAGSDAVVGTDLVIERVPFKIVGIAPLGFSGLELGRSFDIAISLGAEPLVRPGRAAIEQPRSFLLFVMLRLKPQQSLAAATAALRAVQTDVHGPLNLPKFVKEPFTLVPAGAGVDLPGSARPRYQRPLLAIFAIVGLVLLVACANIANLLLARATARRRELSVRLALGAPRWLLTRQLLVESLMLAAIGAAGGLVVAAWSSRAMVAQLGVAMDTPIDWRVLTFTAAVGIVTAVLFGTGAAVRAMRVAPIEVLKQTGRGLTARGGGVSGGLVVAQVALSLVLVTGAGLFARSFTRLAGVPLGFEKDHVLLARVDASRKQLDPASKLDLYQRLIAAAAAAPGVSGAAGSMSTPLESDLPGEVTVPGAPAGTESERVVLNNRITPGWFGVYGTAIRSGRDFDTRDTATSEPVVIVNESFVRKFFPGHEAIGQTVSKRTVVGVVADQIVQGGFKADGTQRSVKDAPPPVMYVPLAQSVTAGPPGRDITISIRSAGDATMPARGVAAALSAIDPDVTFGLRPLADGLDAALRQDRLVALLSGFFGVLAVLLAALGLYGVTSYAVSRQRAEIGIRLALGAGPASVVRFVLSRVAVLVGAGIIAGAGLSIWASTFVASLLYGLAPHDPVTLAGAASLLVVVGAVAGGLPAYRASRIDPVKVLREQ